MAIYQLKIKLDSERYGVSFIGPKEIVQFDYNALIEKIRASSSRYRHLSIRVQYLDDEKCFVDLVPNDLAALSEMFRCASTVENSDFKRVTIRVEEAASPVFRPPPKLKCKEKRPMLIGSSRGLFTDVPTAPTFSQPSTSTSFQPATSSLFKSPIEKYIEKLKEKLQATKERESKVTGWLQGYHKAPKSRGHRDGPMCSNCHRRERHNRLNCPYHTECETFFHCGDITKHPEEKAELNDAERRQRDLLKEIASIENELKVKVASVASIKERYIYKVRSILIESDPTRYLNVGADGTQVENWFQLNKDAKKLESILKGKVPSPGSDIQKLLTETDPSLNPSVAQSCKTSVRNPYRKLWEDRGVQWPTSQTHASAASTSTASGGYQELTSFWQAGSKSHEKNAADDDYMLALGIHESLNTIDPLDIVPAATIQGFSDDKAGQN